MLYIRGVYGGHLVTKNTRVFFSRESIVCVVSM